MVMSALCPSSTSSSPSSSSLWKANIRSPAVEVSVGNTQALGFHLILVWWSSRPTTVHCSPVQCTYIYIATGSMQYLSFCMQQGRISMQSLLDSTLGQCTAAQGTFVNILAVHCLLLLMSSVCCDSTSLGCQHTFKISQSTQSFGFLSFFDVIRLSVQTDSRMSSCALGRFPAKRKSARF